MDLMQFVRASYLMWLSQADLRLVFHKADGTERVMNCTLRAEVLPPVETYKEPELNNGQSILVWDLDKNDWRRFIPNRVMDVEIIKWQKSSENVQDVVETSST